ncbi:hypothetical protein HZB02_03250 [Candidatus Woesearchaeota archaeon]|nr:hypothetical protein [Candidatus Woesearchaeota archaeon]
MEHFPFSSTLEQLTAVTSAIVSKAGNFARDYEGAGELFWKGDCSCHSLEDRSKSAVSLIDLQTQSLILRELIGFNLNRDAELHAEEMTEEVASFQREAGYRWVVDPIDGSLNYGLRWSQVLAEGLYSNRDKRNNGVSVGLQDADGAFLLAVVYLPEYGTLFKAWKGGGAYKDNMSLVLNPLETYPLIASSSLHVSSAFHDLRETLPAEQPGCTTYSITGVVEKKVRAYLGRNKLLHDVGPVSLILQEAGGFVCDFHGREFMVFPRHGEPILPTYLAAPTRTIAEELITHLELQSSF